MRASADCPTGRRSTSAACECPSIPPVTSSARRRSGWSIAVRSGSCRATTRRTLTPPALPFEPVRCHTFVTESTFGLPIYRWPPQELVLGDDQCLVARQPGRGKGDAAVRLRARQGPAAAGRARPIDRAHLHPRRRRADEPPLPRGRYCRSRPLPTPDRWTAAPIGRGAIVVAPALRGRIGLDRSASATMPPASPRGGCWCGERAGGARWTAASRSPTTWTGPACSAPSRRPARRRSSSRTGSPGQWSAGSGSAAWMPGPSRPATRGSATTAPAPDAAGAE